MNHWIIFPILLPLLTSVLLLLGSRRGLAFQRTLCLISTATLLALASALLVQAAAGDYQSYRLGNWPAPFGIVLVLDRLSALMLVLTALVAWFSLLYAVRGVDAQGSYFHALFQFQLLGLNGAFLTGDLFNLFVFFEILLIASYGLLLHGGGKERVRAGFHYVVLNLVGSILFLFALGLLYGITGTLNLADVTIKVAQASPQHTVLLQVSALLLLVVFALKAALFPLYVWLPSAYSHTSAPVAALFAIMTKVGVYAIIRVFTLAFGADAGIAAPWLLPLALATLVTGTVGTLASRDLRTLLAYFVVISVGTLLSAVGLFSLPGLSAAVVYLMHTTLVTAGMFLLADSIRIQRGNVTDQAMPPMPQGYLLGMLCFAGFIALAGLPPLSGFWGKLMILKAAWENAARVWVWSIILMTSLLGLIALARMGSALFWKTTTQECRGAWITVPALLPAVALLACSPLLVAFANLTVEFAEATARQLSQSEGYLRSVLSDSAAEEAMQLQSGGIDADL
jgi:multicomponent K+:H+ antiporter subunit D